MNKGEAETFFAVPINTIQTVQRSRVEDLLCNAFEGGSNYWINTTWCHEDKWPPGSEYGHEVSPRG